MAGPMNSGAHDRKMTLDVVRGIAILLVLLFHFRMTTGVAAVDAVLEPIGNAGWAGVDLFFVLSGFLVGRAILAEASGTGGLRLRRFFFRRALRLWPALYAYLAVLWLVGGAQGWHMIWPVMLHIQNFTHWAPSHLWSLAVEEHFYLAGAVLLPLLLRGGVGRVVLVLAIIVAASLALRIAALAAGVAPLAVQWQTQYRLDALAIGVLLACGSLYRPTWMARAGRFRAWLFLVAGGGFAMLTGADAAMLENGIGFSIAAVASAALVVAMLDATIPATLLLPARAVAWLGTIAYSLYLWHASLGLVAAPLAAAWGIAHPLIVLSLKFALAIFISALLYVLVERPAMRARDWQWRPLPLKGGFARWGAATNAVDHGPRGAS